MDAFLVTKIEFKSTLGALMSSLKGFFVSTSRSSWSKIEFFDSMSELSAQKIVFLLVRSSFMRVLTRFIAGMNPFMASMNGVITDIIELVRPENATIGPMNASLGR